MFLPRDARPGWEGKNVIQPKAVVPPAKTYDKPQVVSYTEDQMLERFHAVYGATCSGHMWGQHCVCGTAGGG